MEQLLVCLWFQLFTHSLNFYFQLMQRFCNGWNIYFWNTHSWRISRWSPSGLFMSEAEWVSSSVVFLFNEKSKVKNKQRRKCEKGLLVVRPLLERLAKGSRLLWEVPFSLTLIKSLLGKAWPKYKKVCWIRLWANIAWRTKFSSPFSSLFSAVWTTLQMTGASRWSGWRSKTLSCQLSSREPWRQRLRPAARPEPRWADHVNPSPQTRL